MVDHPRDPDHRVDVIDTPRRVRVLLDGVVLADTTRAKALLESRHAPRWYIPEEDLAEEFLAASQKTSVCPYKGTANYRSARVGGRDEQDLAWTYLEPLPEVAAIAGHWAFYHERDGVEIEVDGDAAGWQGQH